MKINKLANGKYQASVYLGFDSMTGQQRTTKVTARTKRDVEIKAAAKRLEFKNNGNTIIKKVIPKTFKELAEQWFEEYKLDYDKENTLKQRLSILNVYLYPVLADHKINEITTLQIQRLMNSWVNNAKKEPNGMIRPIGSGKHIKNIDNVLRQIFDFAIRMQLIDDNPMVRIKTPKVKITKQKKPPVYLNREECKAFINALMSLNGSYDSELTKAFFFLLLMTGMRISEALALEWTDVDFKHKTITINKTLLDSGTIQDEAKSDKSNRVIDIDDKIADVIQSFQDYQLTTCLELEIKAPDFIFYHLLKGKIYPRQSMETRLTNVLKNNNIKHISPHCLRHSCASMLIDAGATPKEVQHQLGHKSINTTLDIYGHLTDTRKKENASLLSRHLNI